MPLINDGLAPESIRLLTPEPGPSGFENPTDSFVAHSAREARLGGLLAIDGLGQTIADRRRDPEAEGMDYLTPEAIEITFQDTQYQGETHRLLTPLVQETLCYPDTRLQLLQGMNDAVQRSSERVVEAAERAGGDVFYDVAVVGSGPHGAAAAMEIQAQYPYLRVLMVDKNGLGGQWSSYGPNAAFWMNSRVRAANRGVAPIPRTPGNINPLGTWATVELSDVVKGNYATNVEMGNTTALNAYLATEDFLVGYDCKSIEDYGSRARMTVVNDGGNVIDVTAQVIVDATGVDQESTLNIESRAVDAPWYFSTSDGYRHFGNHKGLSRYNPLEQFSGKDIIVVGGGDGALTTLEALLGNLPEKTYGSYGVGRYRPNSITWIGAPGTTAAEIDACLRSRYKNGIIQALPKFTGDQGGLILPLVSRATSVREFNGGPVVNLDNGSSIVGSVLFDCSNRKRVKYGPTIQTINRSGRSGGAVIKVGPGANLTLPRETLDVINSLGIGENTVALWALMDLTTSKVQNTIRNASLGAINNLRRKEAQARRLPQYV
jgi:hypothetical protein